MAYTKTVWTTGDLVTAALMNHMETQYDGVMAEATSAATANKLVIRDASGRAKAAAPSAEDDIALLSNCFLRNGGDLNGAVNYDTVAANRIYRVITTTGATNPPPEDYGQLLYYLAGSGYRAQIYVGAGTGNLFVRANNDTVWSAWRKVWHTGNDGSGSGLDADTVDGSHKTDITKLSAMATVKIDGNTTVSANTESNVTIQAGTAGHRFYKYSAYIANDYIAEGARVSPAEAVVENVHTYIHRAGTGAVNDTLSIVNGIGSDKTVYYKVYQFTE